ncbi:hypothetical protein HU200_041319 [Digitaria exilis]|uniref:Uncharacterized protein n=1 Tax=Digitaria exilis TaxID=1010633 RepID=A0A835B7Y6_9POAL|nr:hypothetical protein HU200_041319 [Digitaria exilis]
MQRSVWARTISSPACVHAIETSDDGSHTSAITRSGEEESRKKVNKKVRKLLQPLKHRQLISRALRSLSWGAKMEPGNKDCSREEFSDVETTFVSANSSELRSSTDVDDSEPPSFHLSTLPIFPSGMEHRPPASPLKIVRKLPFGYVIGRQLDEPTPVTPSVTKLARKIKKVVPLIAVSYLRSRSQMIKMKVGRALKEACRRGRQHGEQEEDGCGGHDDEDVFWKKDVKGLRCRPLEDDDAP